MPEIKIAIEVQGEQHYKFIPFFHSDYDGFLDQLKRDDIKRNTCAIEGIELIEIDNQRDVIFFIDRFSSNNYKQKPLSTTYQKSRATKTIERKLARMQDTIQSINNSLAECTDRNKEDRLLTMKENLIDNMCEISDKLLNM